ncbi:MAG: hypothetical protein WDM92_05045 [Caulobacteraceae bacterium]
MRAAPVGADGQHARRGQHGAPGPPRPGRLRGRHRGRRPHPPPGRLVPEAAGRRHDGDGAGAGDRLHHRARPPAGRARAGFGGRVRRRPGRLRLPGQPAALAGQHRAGRHPGRPDQPRRRLPQPDRRGGLLPPAARLALQGGGAGLGRLPLLRDRQARRGAGVHHHAHAGHGHLRPAVGPLAEPVLLGAAEPALQRPVPADHLPGRARRGVGGGSTR